MVGKAWPFLREFRRAVRVGTGEAETRFDAPGGPPPVSPVTSSGPDAIGAARAGRATRASDPLSVLITNVSLEGPSGTTILVRDFAIGLRRLGHEPIVYSPYLGDVAEEIRAASIPVTDDIGTIDRRIDVIHAHHTPTAVTALARFPQVPALFFCHDFVAWYDIAPKLPTIHRYVGVSELLADRLEVGSGIPRDRIAVLLNPVDTRRFKDQGPIRDRPAKAVMFSKGARFNHLVESACARHDIGLEIYGRDVGRVTMDPAGALADCDILFGSGLSVLEGIASGKAVVVCDQRGFAGLCTRAAFRAWRPFNFGLKILQEEFSERSLDAAIEGYSAEEARSLREEVADEISLDRSLERLVALYREACAWHMQQDAGALGEQMARDLALHLQAWAPRPRRHWPWIDEHERLSGLIAQAKEPLAPLVPGRRYGFSNEDEAGWRALMQGFSQPDPQGTWTDGEGAALHLRLAGRSAILVLRLEPFGASPDRPQFLTVLANGRPVLSAKAFAACDDQTVELVLAEEELDAAGGHVWLYFRIDDPRTPRSLGLGNGQRRLGVRLKALEVVDSGERVA